MASQKNELFYKESEYLEQFNAFGLKEFVSFLNKPSFLTSTKLNEVIIEKNSLYSGALASRVLAASKYIFTMETTEGSSKARKYVEMLFKRVGINNLCLQLNNAIGPGAALIALEWSDDGLELINFESVSPSFLQYTANEKKYYITLKQGVTPYEDIKDSIFLYTPKLLNPYQRIRLGLVWKAALPYFLQTLAKSNWLKYTKSYGRPFRNAKLPKRLSDSAGRSNPAIQQQLDTIKKALTLIGEDGYSMLPDDVDLEVLVSAASANPDVFQKFIKDENDLMLIAVLGQTLTVLEGGAKADSEVKYKVKKELLDHDLFNIQAFINKTFIPLVCTNYGLSERDWPSVIVRHDDSLGKEALIANALVAKEKGFDVDAKWFEEISGIKLASYTAKPEPAPANPNRG